MATHQRQFFRQRNQLDGHGLDIGFFHYETTARRQHAQQLSGRLLLIADVMKGVYHKDSIKAAGRERKSFGVGARRLEAIFFHRLADHAQRWIREDNLVHETGHAARNATGSTANVKQPMGWFQTQQLKKVGQIHLGDDALVMGGYQTKVIQSGQLQGPAFQAHGRIVSAGGQAHKPRVSTHQPATLWSRRPEIKLGVSEDHSAI